MYVKVIYVQKKYCYISRRIFRGYVGLRIYLQFTSFSFSFTKCLIGITKISIKCDLMTLVQLVIFQ